MQTLLYLSMVKYPRSSGITQKSIREQLVREYGAFANVVEPDWEVPNDEWDGDEEDDDTAPIVS